jgi:hypothetical protein
MLEDGKGDRGGGGMSRSLVCVVVALVIVSAVPYCVTGYNPYERAWMFITYPPGDYGVGDTVTFTVHVVEEGEYITPDSIEAERSMGNALPIQEIATGMYTIDYRISERDMAGSSPGFTISVRATLNRTGWDGEPVDIILYKGAGIGYPRPFELDLSIDEVADMHPSPGDTVEFTITTRFEGEPVDLEDPPYVSVVYNMSSWDRPLAIHSGTGLYKGSFMVSSTEGELLTVSASGAYGQDFLRYGASDREEISVELLHVWGHVVDILPYKTTVELVFTDTDGSPAAGADVDLEWMYWMVAWYKPKYASGTTDDAGRLILQIRHPDIDEEIPNVIVDGIVRWGNLTQRFQGDLWVQDFQYWSRAATWELDVVVETPQPLPLGEVVTLEHTATVNGTPVVDRDIFVYIWDHHDLLYTGRVGTDSQGRFSFDLDIPASLPGGPLHAFVYAWYQYDLDGQMKRDVKHLTIGDYSRWDRFDLMLDPAATNSVEPYAVNRSLSVSLNHAWADGIDEAAYLLWGIGPVPDWKNVSNLEWESWNHGSRNALRMVPLNWSGGAYVGSIELPDFLTASSEIFIYGVINFTKWREDQVSMVLRSGLRPLVTNQAPTIKVTSPVPGGSYWETLSCSGSSADDRSVARVETRIDGGDWTEVTGTTVWSMELDTVSLGEGSHTLDVRAFDGYLYSEVGSVDFEVYQPQDNPEHLVDSPIPMLVLLVVVAVGVLVMVLVRRRSD